MRRHRFDPVSAIPAAIFVVVGANALLGGDRWPSAGDGLLWAVLLLLAGLMVLAAAFRRDSPPAAHPGSAPTPKSTPEPPPLTDVELAVEELRAESRDRAGRDTPGGLEAGDEPE